MFGREPKIEAVKLQEIKLDILDHMINETPGSDRFSALRKELEKIEKMQNPKGMQKIDINTALLVGGNLLGILVIVAYEQKHVFASTARNFVLKTKT
ncbi:MAG TPA: hypothetical protein VLG69_01090 [Candidatus Andersenbacteria bacterium]|nr:hypothetical protein [Candidatus Andersenbacteria bacterium]